MIADMMLEQAKPSDFGVPDSWMNSKNMKLWSKSIKELRKVEKQTTPRRKLQYLLNSTVILN